MATPMGPSATRNPALPKTPEEKQASVLEKAAKIQSKADDLWIDLHKNSATLKEILVEYQRELERMASENPICQSLQRIVKVMRFKIELAPRMAEIEARRLAGKNLMSIVDNEPAPKGIPGLVT